MDIVKEILRLPNFGYVFWGRDDRFHTAILGGQSCMPPDKCEYELNYDHIHCIHDEMTRIYAKENLGDDEKVRLARLMKKMMSACFTRRASNFTHKEQIDYINGLTEEEREQIENQVQMYIDCRLFYQDYIHQ